MPSPFVYRSLQSIRPGFSVTKERCVMSIVFLSSFPASFFLRLMSTFCPFSNEFGEPELCMLSMSYQWHV